ncbi:MAG: UDP-N-acetylmuramoyl-tripeptide--D-alanyl-D-alanine ligase [Cyclobacteriaceae bacterium]
MMTDIKFLYDKYKQSGKVSTDTRTITPGSVFFSLKGERFNANEFAAQALQNGASYAVVDEERWVKGDAYILVNDALEALQQLARYHRDQLTIPIVALTGSNGKTTTKELLHAVLSQKYEVTATKGNLNNHIGVPLTILDINRSTEVAVVEMGANHVGEIATLCKIANPTHGLITNIGKAHIGTFGGFENIIRGKSEMYQHLIDHDGVVWINSQNPILFNMAKRFQNPLLYPSKGDFYHCEMISADPYVKVKTEDEHELNTNLVGAYNFENVALALCVGKFFEVDANKTVEAIANYKPTNMRSQVLEKGSNTILLDAYNANPSSMKVAIDSLAKMKGKRKVAILGDMYELEGETEREHKKIVDLLINAKIDEAFLCGALFLKSVEESSAIKVFSTKEKLSKYLESHKFNDSIILIKASRGMALESVMDHI